MPLLAQQGPVACQPVAKVVGHDDQHCQRRLRPSVASSVLRTLGQPEPRAPHDAFSTEHMHNTMYMQNVQTTHVVHGEIDSPGLYAVALLAVKFIQRHCQHIIAFQRGFRTQTPGSVSFFCHLTMPLTVTTNYSCRVHRFAPGQPDVLCTWHWQIVA
jgi:hypothetical protein